MPRLKEGQLIQASQRNKLMRVKDLLKKKFYVDEIDEFGRNSLWFACCKGYADIAKVLIENGNFILSKSNFIYSNSSLLS